MTGRKIFETTKPTNDTKAEKIRMAAKRHDTAPKKPVEQPERAEAKIDNHGILGKHGRWGEVEGAG